MKILSILARYGTEKYGDAEQALDDLLARRFPRASCERIVVDTALSPEWIERQGRRMLLGSRNDAGEFTAFDTALAAAGSRLHEFDFVSLATSAFRQLYTAYLERFDEAILRRVAGRGVCLGHVDCYNDAIRIFRYASQHWMRTSFVMIPPAELAILGSLVSVRDREPFFSGEPSAPFREDAPLSAGYQRLIIDWLTGSDIGQGVTWHSRIPLSHDTLDAFERKALAILNEHLLAIRLRLQGCVLCDVTWLSSLPADRPVDYGTPWRKQLSGRNRDAVVA